MKEAGIKCRDTFTGINCITPIKEKTNNTPLFGLDEELPLLLRANVLQKWLQVRTVVVEPVGLRATKWGGYALFPSPWMLASALCKHWPLCGRVIRETMGLIWQVVGFQLGSSQILLAHGQGLQQQVRTGGFRCLVAQTGDPQQRGIAHVGGWMYFGVSEWPVMPAVSW